MREKERQCFVKKKGIFVLDMILKLVFIMWIIYCSIHRCLCPLFILFLLSYQFLKKQNIETMLTFPTHTIGKGSTTKWMKKEARTILICFSLIKSFANNQKIYSSHLQVSILHRVASIKVYLTFMRAFKKSYLKKVFIP